VFTDVERLCNVHIPAWLASPGMDEAKIAAFYDDPAKKACDSHSIGKAYHMRSMSIDAGLPWTIRRWGRFAARLGAGTLRPMAATIADWSRRRRRTRVAVPDPEAARSA
jgi:hypothetical protein